MANPSEALVRAARLTVVDHARRLVPDGLIKGTSGNVSVRIPDTELIAITPASTPYENLTEDSIPVLNLDGDVVIGSTTPSSEVPLHLAVYRRHDLGAVVHTHSLYATVVSCVDDRLPNIHYMTASMGGSVPVVPYARYGSPELADSVGEAMTGRKAVIMGNHGAVTAGATLAEAYKHSVNLEWMCELFVQAQKHGTPRILDDDEILAVGERMKTRGYAVPATIAVA